VDGLHGEAQLNVWDGDRAFEERGDEQAAVLVDGQDRVSV
jgi:hypothetical protein